MTREEMIKLAEQVGDDWENMPLAEQELLIRYAALVAAREREECAKLAAWILKMPENDVSSAIRARGMK